jgi:hypothetical protein
MIDLTGQEQHGFKSLDCHKITLNLNNLLIISLDAKNAPFLKYFVFCVAKGLNENVQLSILSSIALQGKYCRFSQKKPFLRKIHCFRGKTSENGLQKQLW